MSNDHPYNDYENTAVWKSIDKAIAELVGNGDLAELTARPYIVGYLTKAVLSRKPSSAQLRALRKKLKQNRAVLTDFESTIAVLGDSAAS